MAKSSNAQAVLDLDIEKEQLPQSPSPFLRDLTIEFGPMGKLGRFFLRADQAARDRGVTLAFATFADMQKVNAANRNSWGTLMPMFDPAQSDFDGDTTLCLLGYDAKGDVVATQAARHFDLTGTSLKEQAENLALFFGKKPPPANARCTVTTDIAAGISDSLVYSGSTWFRPDYRRCGLSTLLPRVSRSYALATWNSQHTCSFVDWILVEKGVTERYGYKRIEDGIEMIGIVESDFNGAIAWMDQNELLADMDAFSTDARPQIKSGLG